MKIIIITQNLSPIVKPLLTSEHQIVGIIESAPRAYNLNNRGVANILIDSIKTIINIISNNSLKFFSKKNKIPYFFLTKHNSEVCAKWINDKKCDLIVVYSMSQLLNKKILELPKYGVVNLHPSLLPKYRGPNPLFWTYYFFEKKGGVTIHFLDEGEDTGDIIDQKDFCMPFGEELNIIYDNYIFNLGVPLLMSSINCIENGTCVPIPQEKISPTIRARNLTDQEYKKIIDWNTFEVERVWHILRGYINHKPLINSNFCLFGRIWEISGFKHLNTENLEKGFLYSMPHLFYYSKFFRIYRREGLIALI